MICTVNDMSAYLEGIFKEFVLEQNSFGIEAVLEEVNSLQQLYFSKYHVEYETVEVPYGAPGEIIISNYLDPTFGKVEREDVKAVFANGVEIPLVSPVTFLRGTGDAAVASDGKLELRIEEIPLSVMVIVAVKPQKIRYENGKYEGSLYIPERHLPMVGYKIRECLSRLTGDHENEMKYGEFYNRFIELLQNEKTAKSEQKERKAL